MVINDDDSGKCVNKLTIALWHKTSHNAVDLSVNNQYDFSSKDGVTFGFWGAFVNG